MARRVLVCFALALLAAGPAVAQDLSGRKATVDNRLAGLTEKIDAAKVREAELSREIGAVTGRIQELEAKVGDVSVRLAVLEADLALHRQKLARVSELLQVQTQRLRFLKRQYAGAVARLNHRLVQIYETEDVDALDVVLSAHSFSDALEQLDYVGKLGSQDRRIAGEVGTARDELRVLRARTAATKRRVAAVTRVIAIRTEQARVARNQLLSNQQSLVAMRSDRSESLVHVRETAEQLRSEAAALSAVSAQLTARIQAAQSVSTTLAVQSGGGPDSTPSASGLIWPVGGSVVSPFGWRWGRMHEGIDISAGYGTPVVASAAGIVIHAGSMGGYGNLVIVDHGGGLATAYAHLSSFATGGGSVSQGQTIGYIGCTGHCFGPHLHFEVRVNGAPVDPLGYL